MKGWLLLLLLLAVACAAAFGWHALAVDPGYLLIRYGGTRIETTLVFALVALLVLWGLVALAARVLRWPFRAWRRRHERRGRERIAAGLVALAEGRYERALRELERAAQHPGLRAPALLAAARAAHARGDTARADTALDEAATSTPAAALALRARFRLEQGEVDAALALLRAAAPDADAIAALPPAAVRLLAEAALLRNDPAAARAALTAFGRGESLAPAAFASLQTRVLVAALTAAPDAETLAEVWSGLDRGERALPEVTAAYARRAAAFGLVLPALDALEARLRRDWNETLIRVYGELGEAEADTRLRRAEGWLEAHPHSPGLLLALGRLCIQCRLWGKAREYLERGLAVQPAAPLWEALGDCCVGQERHADAARCYRNALRCARGEPTEALAEPPRAPLNTRASVVEERSEHGVPRLGVSRD